MTLRDDSHQLGKIVLAAMLGIEVGDPRQICLAIDEVQFFPPRERTCHVPPVEAVQAIDTGATMRREHDDVPVWQFNTTYDVSVVLSDVRGESSDCNAAETIEITQTVPGRWMVTGASSGGDIQGTAITWMLSASEGIPESLNYQVRSDDTAGNVRFVGKISEPRSPCLSPDVTDCVGDTRVPRFLRGDCNGDGEVNISDALFALGSLFLGEGGSACGDACDSNDDGGVDISDAIATLGVLFLGQGQIPLPGMDDCGVDPTADELSCDTFEGCQ